MLKKILNELVDDNAKHRKLAQERLHEIMEKKGKIKEYEDEKEKERTEKLKAQEKHKELLDELEPKVKVLTDDLAKTQVYFEKELARKSALVPDQYKSLIPNNLDIRDKLEWIDNFLQTMPQQQQAGESGKEEVTTTPAGAGKPQVNAGSPGPSGPTTSSTKTSYDKVAEIINSATNEKDLKDRLNKLGRTVD
jgi:hypothetical protein